MNKSNFTVLRELGATPDAARAARILAATGVTVFPVASLVRVKNDILKYVFHLSFDAAQKELLIHGYDGIHLSKVSTVAKDFYPKNSLVSALEKDMRHLNWNNPAFCEGFTSSFGRDLLLEEAVAKIEGRLQRLDDLGPAGRLQRNRLQLYYQYDTLYGFSRNLLSEDSSVYEQHYPVLSVQAGTGLYPTRIVNSLLIHQGISNGLPPAVLQDAFTRMLPLNVVQRRLPMPGVVHQLPTGKKHSKRQ